MEGGRRRARGAVPWVSPVGFAPAGAYVFRMRTLAMAGVLGVFGDQVAGASIGTDGIDGPTDAAGAIVDTTTLPRAAAAGLDAGKFLDDNNTYVFFERLGDLIKTGPTATNVGDLQVILAG